VPSCPEIREVIGMDFYNLLGCGFFCKTEFVKPLVFWGKMAHYHINPYFDV
jgi:hypothetical protein